MLSVVSPIKDPKSSFDTLTELVADLVGPSVGRHLAMHVRRGASGGHSRRAAPDSLRGSDSESNDTVPTTASMIRCSTSCGRPRGV